MAINMVEMQGMLPRQQDFQIIKQNEDAKVLVDQNNYHIEGEKNNQQTLEKVKQQEDSELNKDGNDQNKNAYQGDGGRRRKREKDGVVVKKNSQSSFDFRV